MNQSQRPHCRNVVRDQNAPLHIMADPCAKIISSDAHGGVKALWQQAAQAESCERGLTSRPRLDRGLAPPHGPLHVVGLDVAASRARQYRCAQRQRAKSRADHQTVFADSARRASTQHQLGVGRRSLFFAGSRRGRVGRPTREAAHRRVCGAAQAHRPSAGHRPDVSPMTRNLDRHTGVVPSRARPGVRRCVLDGRARSQCAGRLAQAPLNQRKPTHLRRPRAGKSPMPRRGAHAQTLCTRRGWLERHPARRGAEETTSSRPGRITRRRVGACRHARLVQRRQKQRAAFKPRAASTAKMKGRRTHRRPFSLCTFAPTVSACLNLPLSRSPLFSRASSTPSSAGAV